MPIRPKKEKGWLQPAFGTLALACGLAQMAYLCLLGRMPARAINCALFPALALLACLATGVDGREERRGALGGKLFWLAPLAGLCAFFLTKVVTVAIANMVFVFLALWVALAAFDKLPEGGWIVAKRRTLPFTLALLLVAIGIGNDAFVASQSALRDLPEIMADNVLEGDFEAYAWENPEMLLVRNPMLFRDSRFLPDTSRGVPANTIVWGDWNCRTPTWYGQLARYGFDNHGFQAEVFLSDAILYADTADRPPDYFLRYLSAHIGSPVAYELYGTYGQLRFFRFR